MLQASSSQSLLWCSDLANCLAQPSINVPDFVTASTPIPLPLLKALLKALPAKQYIPPANFSFNMTEFPAIYLRDVTYGQVTAELALTTEISSYMWNWKNLLQLRLYIFSISLSLLSFSDKKKNEVCKIWPQNFSRFWYWSRWNISLLLIDFWSSL